MNDQIFDVSRYTLGVPHLEAYVHRNKKVPETVAAQRRLLRKWQARATQLRRYTSLEPELVDRRQLEQVSRLVDHAFATHPFYRRLYGAAGFTRGDIVTWRDYEALPTITKQDVIAHFESFRSANLAPDLSECYSSTTSGSSGQVLTALFDRAAIDEDIMLCLRFYEQMLGRERAPSEWLYQIYLASPPFTSLDGRYPTFTVSNECPPETVLEHLRRFRPALLSGFPSYLERLGALVRDDDDLGVLAINTNSEASTVAERRRIAERFRAPVFDEYSSVELGLIATQCREGHYHVVEDCVRVDAANQDAEGRGDIVATSLFNSFMPFIRYRQGDAIQFESSSAACACGSRFRRLATFLGRTDQFLLSRAVGKVPPDQVMALYDRTLLIADANISEFQIVQRALDEVHLTLVPADAGKAVDDDLLACFANGLRDLFNDRGVRVVVESRSALPPERSHKRRLIKCELDAAALGVRA